ncbi:hypothetical protein AB0B01_00970 [Streptomyces sp. NPDC044571]|uniref:hypothetical protein n=1 Tax=Streptomyces sp. NPDC044571 TaxID=3155371 RepID=UPI0033E585D0
MTRERFIELAESFISGEDRSMEAVRKMEDILVRDFMDTDLFESTIESISLYRPWEGSPYVGEEEMADVLRDALAGMASQET